MTARRKPRGEGASEKAAKTGKDERPQIREFGITPMEFYKKYVPVDVNDLSRYAMCRWRVVRLASGIVFVFPPMWRKRVIWSL